MAVALTVSVTCQTQWQVFATSVLQVLSSPVPNGSRLYPKYMFAASFEVKGQTKACKTI